MKPLRLIMTAFGPYAQEQIIDFSELHGRNLFLITGPTGSGKTTVFDAICYAIYGKASGRDRDGESLRSHFAEDDLLTSVELEFELRGKKYWIKRTPKQIRRKVSGDGFTEQNAQAQFKALDDPNARIIDGVRVVDEKVTNMIGITYEQFKQIIMIPQGEFRELLTADSTSREGILQKIFGTETFRKIQERLGDKAKEIKKEVETLEKQRETTIENLNATDHEELTQFLSVKPYQVASIVMTVESVLKKDQETAFKLDEEIKGLEGLITEKQTEIHTAQVNNQKLLEKEKAEQTKNALENQKPVYEKKQEELDKARRAAQILPLEENYLVQAEQAKIKETEYLIAEKNEKSAKEHVERVEQALLQEKAREPEREKANQRLTLLQESRKKVQELQTHQNQVQEAQQQYQSLQKDKHLIEKTLQDLKNRLNQNQASLELSLHAATEYVVVCNEKEKVETLYQKTSDLKIEREKLSAFTQQLEEQKSLFHKVQNAYHVKEEEYQKAHQQYLEGLAGTLAGKLEPGKACPVCGSEHHPTPAQKSEGVLSEQQLQELEIEYKTIFDTYQNTRIQCEKAVLGLESQQKIVQKLEKELKQLKNEEPSCEEDLPISLGTNLLELRELSQRLIQEMNRLEELKKQEIPLREKLQQNNTLLMENENKLKDLVQAEIDLYSRVESIKGMINAIEKDLPDSIRTADGLEAEINKVQRFSDQLKHAYDQAMEACNKCKEKYAFAQSSKLNADKNREESVTQKEKARTAYLGALVKAGFLQEEQYKASKMDETKIRETEQGIKTFHQQLKSAEDYLHRLVQDAQGLVPVDISSLEEKLKQIQICKLNLFDQKTVVISRMDHNRKMYNGILRINQTIEQKEEKYLLIGDLANTARGFNSQKISFERYVLAAFFNDIITAANLRFQKMTCGRYHMNRITEKGKGAGQSGLELEVFDYYTGRARHVKTLSGGESFKASLALALGLADVVQSYAGGVSLDTMFIDEGFGTLDPESLDNAISCLIELQQAGRLVGIISHVPELKTSIDARLEVEAHKNGSKAKFIVN